MAENKSFEAILNDQVDIEQEQLISFKDLESYYGQKDQINFLHFLSEVITNQVKVEDLVDKEQLDVVLENRFYSGFTLSKEVNDTIKQAHLDEYGMGLEELNSFLRGKRWAKDMSDGYRHSLKLYYQDLK